MTLSVIIALIIWEGMVLYIAIEIIKAFKDDWGTRKSSLLSKVGNVIYLTAICGGIAFLPFSGVFYSA